MTKKKTYYCQLKKSGNNNNNNITTPTIPTAPTNPGVTDSTVPENNITIPDDTTPLSPAPAEVSTTPTTETEDNNEDIDIEDDDTALGAPVIDNDVDETEDVPVPVKTKKKVVAKEEKSLDINADDTPLGTTLPKTGGSFGFIYILFGLLLSAFGIKKFREK